MTDQEIDNLSDGDLYHYLLDKDCMEWAKVANRKSKLGLSADKEEILGVWFASAMMCREDRDNAAYIRARLDAEHAEDEAQNLENR